jgi:hypothetical protein
MAAAYQDKRITINAEGMSVGQKAFTMNLVNSAAATLTKRGKPPWKKLVLSFALTLFIVIAAFCSYSYYGIEYLSWRSLQPEELTIFFNVLMFVFCMATIILLARCLWLNRKLVYNLTLDISGNDQIVLSSTDKDYIHMLAGLINTFKGYTPHPEPSFDYEGEVLE